MRWEGSYYLLAFKDRREPNAQDFEKVRDQLRNRLLQAKQQMIFASWLDGERRQAKIQVYVEE